MSPQLVYIFANVLAAQARIEGMKALNAQREAEGHAQAYDEDAFLKEADHLYNLSIEARNSQ